MVERKVKNYNPFKNTIRLVKFKTIHFTLHFFSSLSCEKIEELVKVTKGVTSKHEGFKLTLEEPGFFPNERRPRVFWWSVRYSQELMDLQKELNDEYAKKKYPLEKRSFIPHVTIGRFKERILLRQGEKDRLREKWKLSGEKFKVTEVKLFKSPAGPEGYETLQVFPLGG